ncbi:uncharacterized protein BJX67DRAFT_159277 [Aspergillus lucknowensis]|uniref:Uncharacterized protein n=1 Tax=Aspergillus lucknowensis TaxID=176173 RepID=A0ABR4M409_9EURO
MRFLLLFADISSYRPLHCHFIFYSLLYTSYPILLPKLWMLSALPQPVRRFL